MKINFLNLNINNSNPYKKDLNRQETLKSDCLELNKLNGNYFSSIKLSFNGAQKVPVYVISPKGTFKKFASQKEAAEYLNCSTANVGQAVNYQVYSTKGVAIIRASEIEKLDKNGQTTVDKTKIEEIAKSIDKTIYVIRYDGTYKKCSSRKEAAQYMGCGTSNLGSLFNGKKYTLKGCTIVKASEVETTDAKGIVSVNEEKIREIAKSIDKSLYVITPEGKYQKYSSQAEAALALKIDPTNISAILKNKTHTLLGCAVVKASDIETTDEQNNTIIEPKKLDEIIKKINKNLYVFNQYGLYKKCSSRMQAAEYIGCDYSTISLILCGKVISSRGFSVIRASEVENQNQDGSFEVNEEKIKEIAKKINRGVYVISQDGTYKKYSNQSEASKELKVPAKSIANVLKGKAITTGGYRMVKAADIEILDKEGRVVVDEEKLKEILSKK